MNMKLYYLILLVTFVQVKSAPNEYHKDTGNIVPEIETSIDESHTSTDTIDLESTTPDPDEYMTTAEEANSGYTMYIIYGGIVLSILIFGVLVFLIVTKVFMKKKKEGDNVNTSNKGSFGRYAYRNANSSNCSDSETSEGTSLYQSSTDQNSDSYRPQPTARAYNANSSNPLTHWQRREKAAARYSSASDKTSGDSSATEGTLRDSNYGDEVQMNVEQQAEEAGYLSQASTKSATSKASSSKSWKREQQKKQQLASQQRNYYSSSSVFDSDSSEYVN